jgi:hypothetical protein
MYNYIKLIEITYISYIYNHVLINLNKDKLYKCYDCKISYLYNFIFIIQIKENSENKGGYLTWKK